MTKQELLRKFKYYKQQFKIKDVVAEGEQYFFDGIMIDDGTNRVWETENFIVIKYGAKNSISRVLSNLYPIQFTFRHKKVNSIESVLQGIKYQNKKVQAKVFNYFGVDAYHTRACNSFDFWGDKGLLYWQGKPIKRNQEEYQDFLDELYLSAFKNPLYFRALLATNNKYLLHHIGRTNQNETVLTRFEYESRLFALQQLANELKSSVKF